MIRKPNIIRLKSQISFAALENFHDDGGGSDDDDDDDDDDDGNIN
jgi:hypothetical protein